MSRVTVIVPVFDGRAAAERCIAALLRGAPEEADILLVDDASSDEGLSRWLEGLAVAHDHVKYLRNDVNLGFAGAVNRGFATSTGDVVVLNSDAEVPAGWLARLKACAERDAGIGTVTPFTNNGSICSYPLFCASSDMPAGLTLHELDGLFATANAGVAVEVPTGVGFCMYISRACLDAVGDFDEARFGKGYGEENDFCRRAAAAGFRHVLCGDLFVFHEGGVSFGDSRRVLMERADGVMAELHPSYGELVERFIRDDPAAPLRAAVDALRRNIPGQMIALLDESNRRCSIAEARLREIDAYGREERQVLQTQLTQAREAFAATDHELESARSSYAALERQLMEARDAAAAIERDFRELEERTRGLLGERDSLEDRCQRLSFELSEVRDQRDELKAHFSEAQRLLDEAREAFGASDAALAETRDDLLKAEAHSAALQAQLDKLNGMFVVRVGKKLKGAFRVE